MTTCYRPTTLKLASAHCPRAVDYYEQNRPAFREHMAPGIAAHECLAIIGSETLSAGRQLELGEIVELCQRMTQALATTGRQFEGTPEPPMSMEDAQEGAALALRYATAETTRWLTADAWYEVGQAFDADWTEVPYQSPRRRFRLILDVAEVIDDAGEEYAGRIAVVRDYKTSWATDESELQTYQMRSQAVAAYLTRPDVDCIRREVVNLRSSQIFRDDLWLESGGKEQIEEWRRDITAYMQALDDMRRSDGSRPARPGAGCLSCPWSLHCDANEFKGQTAEIMGQRLSLLDGQRAQLIKALKLAAKDKPMNFDGNAVGWRQTSDLVPIDAAARAMFDTWAHRGGDINGFLAAIKPGMGSLRAVAKKLSPEDKDGQQELVTKWSRAEPGREFTVWRTA